MARAQIEERERQREDARYEGKQEAEELTGEVNWRMDTGGIIYEAVKRVAQFAKHSLFQDFYPPSGTQ